MREVGIHVFAAARADGALAIDVREPHEYLAGHIPGVRLLPMGQVADRLAELPRNAPVYVVCQSGNRSLQVTDLLLREGYDARSVAGGTSGWESAGLPVIRGAHADVA